MNASTTSSYLSDLFRAFYDASGESSELEGTSKMSVMDGRQMWVVEQLYALTRGSILKSKEDLILSVVDFLFFHAFYTFNGGDGKGVQGAEKMKKSMAKRLRQLVPPFSSLSSSLPFLRSFSFFSPSFFSPLLPSPPRHSSHSRSNVLSRSHSHLAFALSCSNDSFKLSLI